MELRQNPNIGKRVYINGEEGQIVDVRDNKYVIYTDNNEYHLDNLDNIFCPEESKDIPSVYVQIGLIMQTLRYLVLPCKKEDGTYASEIDYAKMKQGSKIRQAIKSLSDAVVHYDEALTKKSHVPKESFQRVTDMGYAALDTVSLIYFAMLTMSVSKQEEFRGRIEELLWEIAQPKEENI